MFWQGSSFFCGREIRQIIANHPVALNVCAVRQIGRSPQGSLQKHLKKGLDFHLKIEIEMSKLGVFQHFLRS
jgi:hypothetical protein